MTSNREIRHVARALMRTRWFGRLVWSSLALYLVNAGISSCLLRCFSELRFETCFDVLARKIQYASQGLHYALPTKGALYRMLGASAFQLFVMVLISALLIYGFTCLILLALRKKDDFQSPWFGQIWRGYARPLELMWLLFVQRACVAIGLMFLILPGLCLYYRYRAAWYLKADHPEWSARACLACSARLMNGYKWQAFRLDLSFAIWGLLLVLLLGLPFLALYIQDLTVVLGHLLSIVSFVTACYIMYVVFCFNAARAQFYRCLCEQQRDILATENDE